MTATPQQTASLVTAPLSFEQERMWLLDNLVSGNPANHIGAAIELRGELNVGVLKKSLQLLTVRHEILRTYFVGMDGQACQVINPTIEVSLQTDDLQSQPVNCQQQTVRELAQQLIQKAIDLKQSPLWHVRLIRLHETHHVMVLSMHHIICDGDWSARLFFEEAFTIYSALRQGKPSPLLPLPLQYQEFAKQQRASLTDAVLQPHLHYWKEKLGQNPEILQLPTDHSRPAIQTYSGATELLLLDVKLLRQLTRLAEQTHTSLFVLLLGILKVLLYRYTRQESITVGTPSAGRDLDNSSKLIGYFGTPLVLNTTITPDMPVQDVLKQVNDTLTQARQHQDYPFQKLLQALNPERDMSFPPLFQVLFEFREDCLQPFAAGDVQIEPLDITSTSVPYDLVISIKETTQGLVWTFNYNSDLFEASTIQRLAGHCQTIALAIVENSQQTVSKLPLLTPSEQQMFMREWNPISRTDYQRICIHHRVEEQVRRTPDIPAVQFEGKTLSYRQLNEQANQLAHYLLKQSLQPDDFVGICMERSIELLVAILGTLKAGAAYVPLDAAYPADRLEFMLSDSNASIVLTTQASLASHPQFAKITHNHNTILLDATHRSFAEESTDNPQTAVQADHLAYCIYTSGSTGIPKGVEMAHGALSNLIEWHLDHWLAEVGVRTLLFSPISFDVSFHEIAAAWCSGGTLIQIREDIRRNAIHLLDFIQANRIEKAYLPFITLQQLAALVAEGRPVPGCLREIIIGGEPLQITQEIGTFLTRTGCVLHNQYGSTECLVVTAYTLDASKLCRQQVPVGKPDIYNTRVYVLDDYLQPVPVGVTGEIYADSDCLARGYHNRPELNAERFIPNPFSPDFSGRLYRIGDLGRYLSDGNIECLGRADNQVKIRGVRIELGEIEQVLAGHPLVRECVVMPCEDTNGYRRLIGYIVPATDGGTDQLTSLLRHYLQQKLPDPMIPSALVMLDKMPLTPSGKVNRRQLPAPDQSRPELSSTLIPPRSSTEKQIAEVWRRILQLHEVGIHDSFFELGGNSLLLVQAQQQLEKALGIRLAPVALFQYPTIQALAQHVTAKADEKAGQHAKPIPKPASPHDHGGDAIAVIGLACRFPGADSPEAYWNNLKNGVESITIFADHELDVHNPEWLSKPNYVRAGAPISHIDEFDASFFGFNAREAALTDPQQRLLLECAWEALEHAGYNSDSRQNIGSIGVYTGAAISTYLINNVAPALGFSAHQPFLETEALQAKLSNDRNYFATRIAYKLNLTGPALNIQTACSTSLVTVHMACQSLLQGECDMALAGGVSIAVPEKTGYLYRDGMINSPDGHCRAFDAQAEGTLFGSGVGFAVLKRLSAAIADGDQIFAVIKGSAINNDGSAKVGYTAPSIDGQADVISKALAKACFDSCSVGYVEAHGTATKLGDPIEVAALTQAFKANTRKQTLPKQHCALGSVKTNVGHLDEAAGIASFIKTVLSLHHKQIPPTLHFQTPNPQIDFANSPFYVNTQLTAWDNSQQETPRRAGVSAFGMGGTNCHILLEEAPDRQPVRNQLERSHHILALSADTAQALQALVVKYQDYLNDSPSGQLADLCFTANTGRKHFPYRMAVVADSLAALTTRLRDWQGHAGKPSASPVKQIAFLFTGQGSQYANMGRTLYDTQPVFREVLNQCDSLLQAYLDKPLLSVLYPEDGGSLIDETAYTQPALFAIEYALFQLWKSWGIEPDVVMGHSVGEYAAACAAGVFSLEDGLKLIAARGRLMQALPNHGAMISVMASEAQLAEKLAAYPGAIAVAAVNGPNSIVLSGESRAIHSVTESLQADGFRCKQIKTSHAFHSPLMEPMLDEFTQIAQGIRFALPQYTLISNLTSKAIDAEITDADYWVRHIRQPVRFADSVRHIEQMGDVGTFVEIGPQAVLLGMAQQCVSQSPTHWLPSLRLGENNWETLLGSLKTLYLHKAPINWSGVDQAYRRYRLSLPTYPFQRQSYWVKATGNSVPRSCQMPQGIAKPANGLFYQISWIAKAIEDNGITSIAGQTFLILADQQSSLGHALAVQLECLQAECVLAYQGSRFEQQGNTRFMLSPSHPDDFRQLLAAIPRPDGIVNCWSLDGKEENLDTVILNSCGSTLHLVQALANMPNRRSPPRLYLVTQGAQGIDGQAVTHVAQAPLWGFGKVIALEHPELNCVRIDLDSVNSQEGAAQLCRELQYPTSEDQIAYRLQKRYVARLESASPPQPSATPLVVREGSYLISGGLGGLGLKVAGFLIERGAKHLILLGRNHPKLAQQDPIRRWKQQGIHIFIGQVDVADHGRLRGVLEEARHGFPPLRGVIHAAGLLDDGIILKQSWQRFLDVMAPKVQGSWNLHQLTQADELDFFVLFSSSSSLLGSAGQANYAAANLFLDALASYRQGRGQVGMAIDWGAWSDVGITARLQMNAWLEEKGEGSISPDNGLLALERLLQEASGTCQQGVMDIDWPRFLTGQLLNMPFFQNFANHASTERQAQPSNSQTISLLQTLSGLTPEACAEQLHGHVCKCVSLILGTDRDVLEDGNEETGFFKLGMDSLGSIELRNELQVSLSLPLPVTIAFDYPTVEAMTHFLAGEIAALGMANTSRERQPTMPSANHDPMAGTGCASSGTGKKDGLESIAEQLARQLEF